MKDPKTIFGSLVSSDWPATVAKNASGASASDGTPFCADLIDIDWGWIKRIMYLAGITPSGIADDYTASDVVDAIHRAGDTPGKFILSALNAATLALHRWLPLTGQQILIASYSELCTAVYVGDTANPSAEAFYKCTSDGTRSITGAYMKMPDCRGLVPRGMGTNSVKLMANGTPYFGGTYPGSVILDAMQGHYHSTQTGAGGTSAALSRYLSSDNLDTTSATTLGPKTDGINGLPRTGAETCGASFAAQVCIAY